MSKFDPPHDIGDHRQPGCMPVLVLVATFAGGYGAYFTQSSFRDYWSGCRGVCFPADGRCYWME